MDIQAEISWIRTELIAVRDPELITAFKSLLKYRKNKRTETPLTVEDYNAELEAAETRINEGRFSTQVDVEREAEKW